MRIPFPPHCSAACARTTAEPRPTCRLLVTCSCCWISWLYPPEALFSGSPAPSQECFKRARQSARTENAKLIAAAVIAAIRLNRDEIKNSPVRCCRIENQPRADFAV